MRSLTFHDLATNLLTNDMHVGITGRENVHALKRITLVTVFVRLDLVQCISEWQQAAANAERAMKSWRTIGLGQED